MMQLPLKATELHDTNERHQDTGPRHEPSDRGTGSGHGEATEHEADRAADVHKGGSSRHRTSMRESVAGFRANLSAEPLAAVPEDCRDADGHDDAQIEPGASVAREAVVDAEDEHDRSDDYKDTLPPAQPRPSNSQHQASMRVLGYCRICKADRNRDTSLGIEAQREAILRAATAKGEEIVGWHTDDGLPGKDTNRPGLTAALEALRNRRTCTAEALVVAKLDRLSRSVIDFGTLLDRSRRQRFSIAVLDFDLDTSTVVARMLAGVMMQVAQFEREVGAERTRAALAVKKAEAVQLGKPSTIPADVREKILTLHADGLSLSAIARLHQPSRTATTGERSIKCPLPRTRPTPSLSAPTHYTSGTWCSTRGTPTVRRARRGFDGDLLLERRGE